MEVGAAVTGAVWFGEEEDDDKDEDEEDEEEDDDDDDEATKDASNTGAEYMAEPQREVPESAITIVQEILIRCPTVVRVGVARGMVWERRLSATMSNMQAKKVMPLADQGEKVNEVITGRGFFALIDEVESRAVHMPFFMGR